MGFSSKLGRARVSARNPRAAGICDRCGFVYNHINLQWQFDWAGASLINKRILVCDTCNDVPQSQLRAIVVPADPTPILNARVQNYSDAESDYRTTSGQNTTDPTTGIPIPGTVQRITQDSNNRVTQEIGETRADRSNQPGLDQNAIMPLQTSGNTTSVYRVTIQTLSVISDGAGIATVTCSSAHGLSTGDQISVEGLSSPTANGFYTVTVTSGMAFTYQLNPIISAGSLLTSTTKMVTANAGLPYNNIQVPQTGPI
jgi:hypothetical protein